MGRGQVGERRSRLAGGGRVSEGRAGEDVPSGTQIAVELCLDRAEKLRHMLIFINQYRPRTGNKPPRVGADRGTRRGVAAIDDDAP